MKQLRQRGRSQGGYPIRELFVTDGQSISLGFTATACQRDEAPEFEDVMPACQVNLFCKAKRPHALAADKTCSSQTIRDHMSQMQIGDVIPKRSNETSDDDFAKLKYEQRSIGWMKQHGRIATWYEKLVDNDLAMIHVAVARMILNWYRGYRT